MSDYFNGDLHIMKVAQPHCRICHETHEIEFPDIPSNKVIIYILRRNGWSCSRKGMICPHCKVKGKEAGE